MKLVDKGDGDYDLVEGEVVIQLDYDGDEMLAGDWTFWGVTINGQSFGGMGGVAPGPLRDWLDDERLKASKEIIDESGDLIAAKKAAALNEGR